LWIDILDDSLGELELVVEKKVQQFHKILPVLSVLLLTAWRFCVGDLVFSLDAPLCLLIRLFLPVVRCRVASEFGSGA
jgi:hypothetical protein